MLITAFNLLWLEAYRERNEAESQSSVKGISWIRVRSFPIDPEFTHYHIVLLSSKNLIEKEKKSQVSINSSLQTATEVFKNSVSSVTIYRCFWKIYSTG